MKILVAPLNWGLGHASRCVPLIRRWIAQGDEVVLAGDGESLTLLKRQFPSLRVYPLAPLRLRYSEGNNQMGVLLRALPGVLRWMYRDHRRLEELLRVEAFDRVVSDNRFGLYTQRTECIYMTHQLCICMPKGWRWLESVASRVHARIYNRYDAVWVPDYEDKERSLSGRLGSAERVRTSLRYLGPLSRLEGKGEEGKSSRYDVVAVLSGLEPQRSMLEKELCRRYANKEEQVLLVEGRLHCPPTVRTQRNLTLVPYLDDESLAAALRGAKKIICRSGYSSIMDMYALGVQDKVEWIPTPGQSEQMYLYEFITNKHE